VSAPRIIGNGSERIGETLSGPIEVPLPLARVTQCRVDHAFSLVLVEEHAPTRSWVIRIGAPFSLHDPAGGVESFVDDAPPSQWAPAIDALLHELVATARALADGTLSLRLGGGGAVHAPPLPYYESWQITGPKPEEFVLVCAPGGSLARWPASVG